MNLSFCGIDCDTCKYKIEQNCPGCRAVQGKPFWAGDGSCDLYTCATGKDLPHCGKCGEFPCGTLKEWAAQENPERIGNLKALQ